MPKKYLKITDFSGGINAYSDARDILDTQFAQNWNASFDQYGVVRFTGAGVKYTTEHPHKNPPNPLQSFHHKELALP